jgi:hypothetical protein
LGNLYDLRALSVRMAHLDSQHTIRLLSWSHLHWSKALALVLAMLLCDSDIAGWIASATRTGRCFGCLSSIIHLW